MNDLAIIVKFIRTNTEWLYTVLYQNKFFFIDYWSVVHLLSGFLLPVLLSNLKIKRIYFVTILILFLYEVIEISLIYVAFNVFKPETIKDQFTDIFIGVLGVALCRTIKRKALSGKINPEIRLNFYSLLTSLITSFLWVGFYNYQYNFESLNSDGLNLWAFFWWSAGLISVSQFYFRNKKRFKSKIFFISNLYLLYLIALIVLEYSGYNVFSIKEVFHSNSKALIFGLIHGTFALHIFYLTAPFIIIIFFEITKKFFENYLSDFASDETIPNYFSPEQQKLSDKILSKYISNPE